MVWCGGLGEIISAANAVNIPSSPHMQLIKRVLYCNMSNVRTYVAVHCGWFFLRPSPSPPLQSFLQAQFLLVLSLLMRILLSSPSSPPKAMQSHVATSAEHSTEFLLQHVMKLTDLVSQLCAKSGVLNPLQQKTWLTNKVIRREPPWVVKMTAFQETKNKEWYSDPVHSHFGGYKMCLRVDANGDGDGEGTHVSVFTYLMRGGNDDNLKWPFKGTIEVSLLNQLEDGQHYTRELWSPDEVSEDVSGRVTWRARAVSGWGYPQFIHQQDLIYKVDQNCQYLKDDTLFFRVDCFEPKID